MYDKLVSRIRFACEIIEGPTADLLTEAADAIEELQQTAEHYKGCSDDWYKEACDYKAMLPRWIPVTERLPDIGSNCLIFSVSGWVAEGQFDGDGWTQYRWSAKFDKDTVTHWMPLPEPPKEDNLKGDKSMIIIRTNLEELPTTCCDCPLKTYDPQIVWKDALMTQWGGWVCPISGQLINNTKREEFCPLEEAPEPPKENGKSET